MEKQKLLEKLNEARVMEEVDLTLNLKTIQSNTKDKNILQITNKLLKGTETHAKVLADLTKKVLEGADKNEF
ncbi:MAG: hypothetical protein ABH852_00295 [Methanobacteriota archaeon]